MQICARYVDCYNDSTKAKKSGVAEINVRCADTEHRVAVYALKENLLDEIYKLYLVASNARKRDANESSRWLVVLRGQILADCEIIDLYALSSNDFLVVTQDNHVQSSPRPALPQTTPLSDKSNLMNTLLEMGFSEQSVRGILPQCTIVEDAIAFLATENDENGKDSALNAHIAEIDEVIHRYPNLGPMKHVLYDIRYYHQLLEWRLQTRKMQISKAFTTMHELFGDELLDQLVKIPITTLAFLKLPINVNKHFDVRTNQGGRKAVTDSSCSHRQRQSVEDSDALQRVMNFLASMT